MSEQKSLTLTQLREAAGLTVRELARQVGTNHPTILKWEANNHVVKTEYLSPMAKALGVTVEEVMGRPRPSNTITAGGKLGVLFEEVSKLPRSQQQKIADVVKGMLLLHNNKAS
jgi:transcriptional regulator with XRE-family HTH domain